MASTLDEYVAALGKLSPQDKIDIVEATKDRIWISNPGPQTLAFFSAADELLYGGQGGGGKTDLLAGLALTSHERTLLMRPQYTDLGALIERVVKIAGTRKGLNSSPPAQFKYDGKIIDFGAANTMERAETWQGNPHDLIGLDEACQFLEEVVEFVLGWNRAADEDLDNPSELRVRAVLASNPPLSSEGQWVIGRFRPWLDLTHHKPAEHGELRYFIVDPDGKDQEVDHEDDCREWDGKVYTPKSRTFIPAALADNPFLINTRYQTTLDAMPEPLRSAIRDGNFMAARRDDEFQIIPTLWIRAAMDRWSEFPPQGVPMCAMAVDPAAGGDDKSTIARRYDGWFDKIIEKPGRETPMGTEIAGLVVMHRKDNAVVVIDMGGGYGGVPFVTLQENGVEPYAYKGSEASMARTLDRKMAFYNKRTETWWKFREALDPSQKGGSHIALPDDPELLSDLTSVRFGIQTGRGVMTIKAETKIDVVKRLGRSPDKGDAVVMCWSQGNATALGQIIPRDQRFGGSVVPKTVTSRTRTGIKRRR